MSRLFDRVEDMVHSNLDIDDKALLAQIPDLLATVGVEEGDAAFGVINRRAYRTDDDADAEFTELVGAQLDRDRAMDLDALVELTGDGATVSLDEARSALRAINGARLTLASRSGVLGSGDTGWESRISKDPALAAVAWLGYVQSELIAALISPS